MSDLVIDNYNGRMIILRGLGRMFYQDGFPIGMASKLVHDRGLEISWLHIADELIKHGWSSKTIISKLREEISDSGVEFDIKKIETFCLSIYEEQREMIFQYLFNCTTDDVRQRKESYPADWLKVRL